MRWHVGSCVPVWCGGSVIVWRYSVGSVIMVSSWSSWRFGCVFVWYVGKVVVISY